MERHGLIVDEIFIDASTFIRGIKIIVIKNARVIFDKQLDKFDVEAITKIAKENEITTIIIKGADDFVDKYINDLKEFDDSLTVEKTIF